MAVKLVTSRMHLKIGLILVKTAKTARREVAVKLKMII